MVSDLVVGDRLLVLDRSGSTVDLSPLVTTLDTAIIHAPAVDVEHGVQERLAPSASPHLPHRDRVRRPDWYGLSKGGAILARGIW